MNECREQSGAHHKIIKNPSELGRACAWCKFFFLVRQYSTGCQNILDTSVLQLFQPAGKKKDKIHYKLFLPISNLILRVSPLTEIMNISFTLMRSEPSFFTLNPARKGEDAANIF